jgi:hypothetical protein
VIRGRINRGETVDVHFDPFFEKALQNVGTGKAEPIVPTLERLLEGVTCIVDDFQRDFS